MKSCALTIQRRWRATLTARMIQHQFLAIKNAAVKIQLAYRQYRAKRLLRKVCFYLHSAISQLSKKFSSYWSDFCHQYAEI